MVQRNKYQQKEPKIDVLNAPDNREKYQKAIQENIRLNRPWNTNDIDKTWKHFK
jgi:hypothetical protein